MSDTVSEPPVSAAEPTSTGLTDEDLKLTRDAAVRATSLVAMAEKGFIDQFKEAFAASKAIKAAPAEVQKLLVGGMPSMPSARTPQELETETLALLGQARTVISARAPQLLAPYRETVIGAITDVAAAADGTSANEQQVIEKVTAALSA